jgi:hypothetical protein
MYDPKITAAERNAAPDSASAKFSQPIDQAMQKLQVEFAAKYGKELAEAIWTTSPSGKRSSPSRGIPSATRKSFTR